jgi:myo-inositol-1(or 4)-monophosphatase
MADLDELRDLAVDVAREAGALLLDGQRRARAVVETKSTRTDMVTEMDRAAEALIVTRLHAARPGDAVLGEEGGEREASAAGGVRWVVDPLDGTTNYLYGHPTFAVSIAAESGGRTLVGVVFDPAHDELFEAVEGRGARCNGEPVRVSAKADLATALVGTGFGYEAERRARQARVLAGVLPHVRDIRRGGAAALDLCWVACGRLDAFYEQGLQPWDLAAGLLVLAEAGGASGDLDGGPARPGCVLAATPALLGPLRALLVGAGAAGVS